MTILLAGMLTLAAAAEQRRSFCFDCAGWVWTLITCCGLASPPDPEHGVIRLSGSENKQTLFPCSSSQPGPGKVRDSVPKISNHTSFLLHIHMYGFPPWSHIWKCSEFQVLSVSVVSGRVLPCSEDVRVAVSEVAAKYSASAQAVLRRNLEY